MKLSTIIVGALAVFGLANAAAPAKPTDCVAVCLQAFDTASAGCKAGSTNPTYGDCISPAIEARTLCYKGCALDVKIAKESAN